MSEATARIVAELEEVTNRMADGADLSLGDFVGLTGLRGQLVRQWAEYPSSDEDVLRRIGAVVRRGAEAEGRLRAMRQSLRSEAAGAERIHRLVREIRGMVVFAPHALYLEV